MIEQKKDAELPPPSFEQLLSMYESSKRTKVTGVFFKEGGLEMGSQGTQNSLPRNIKGIEMELSKVLGGVLVGYPHRQSDGKVVQETVLVPMSHIRGIKLG